MNIESCKPKAENAQEKQEKELFHQTAVYINAGGRGTRLEPIMPKGEKGITKALIDFDNEPIIQKHVDLLSKLEFGKIIVGAGDHLNIEKYFKNKKTNNLIVANTEKQEDTGGDLIKAVRQIENCGENILVESVDTILYVKNLSQLLTQHEQTKATATIVLTTKKGVPNENAFFVEKDGRVVYTKEVQDESNTKEPESWTGFRGSSTGVVIFKTDFLKNHPWQSGQGMLSIYRDLIPELISRGELYAYDNENNLFVDTGTPDKYQQVKRREREIFKALGKKYLNQ